MSGLFTSNTQCGAQQFTLTGVVAILFWFAFAQFAQASEQGDTRCLKARIPQIIAHRGASAYYPEHTLAAYQAAAEIAADYIEPDLVVTKDGVLIARHDNYLSSSTDVAQHKAFASKKRLNPQSNRTDWWVEDFTLAEIKQLRAKQPFPGRSDVYDGQFQIPTFREILQWVNKHNTGNEKPLGIYPEIKQPTYLKSIALDPVPLLIADLESMGFNHKEARVFIQSFDPRVFAPLREKTPLPLVLLLAPDAEGNPMFDIRDFSDLISAIGPYKGLLIGSNGSSTGLLDLAHKLNLLVHPWTFRNDQLPEHINDPLQEYRIFYQLGVDAVFTDFPDTALKARTVFMGTEGLKQTDNGCDEKNN